MPKLVLILLIDVQLVEVVVEFGLGKKQMATMHTRPDSKALLERIPELELAESSPIQSKKRVA